MHPNPKCNSLAILVCYLLTLTNAHLIRSQSQSQLRTPTSTSTHDEAMQDPKFNEVPMPMHHRFLLERQRYSLNAHMVAVSSSSNDMTDDDRASDHDGASDDDGAYANYNPLQDYYGREMDVLSSSWWVRLAEGNKKPETRRSHAATIYEVRTGDNAGNVDTDGNVVGPNPVDPGPNGPDDSAEAAPTNASDESEVQPGVDDADTTPPPEGETNENPQDAETPVTPEAPPSTEDNPSEPEAVTPKSTLAPTSESTPITPTSSALVPGQRNLQSEMHEYMIVTGGFTDNDWNTFPVWAYDMTSSTTSDNGFWFELTPPDLSSSHKLNELCHSNVTQTGVENALPCAPASRVGHISMVREGSLYVFGGLQYNDNDGVFFMDEEPFMYRMLLSEEGFHARDEANNLDEGFQEGVDCGDLTAGEHFSAMCWKRFLPKVKAPPADMQSAQSEDFDFTVNRGEVRGGYWDKGDKLIVYGGLHVREYETSMGHKQQADTTLGDVWAYDFKTDTWEMMASTGGVQALDHPGERTAHAATVVGDELVIYGGLKKVDTYVWDGSTVWSQLDDIWVFNLNTLEWKQRQTAESMGRAYHAVVGWEIPDREGSVLTAFGGYKTMMDPVDNQQISYVYDDTMVSMPQDHNASQPAAWFLATYNGLQPETISTRLEHSAVLSRQYGNMFVWGGRYRQTNEITGIWSLNIAGEGSTVEYTVGSEDSDMADAGLAYVILVTIMTMSMMFTYMCGVIHRRVEGEGAFNMDSLNADPTMGGTVFGRNGLGQDIIDTLPVKKYQNQTPPTDGDTEPQPGAERSEHTSSQESDDTSASMNFDFEDEDDCCPICLVEYNDGDDIRCLPCNHEFHKSCVDPWLGNNASCPACRHSLSDLVSLTTTSDIAASIRASISGRMRPSSEDQPERPQNRDSLPRHAASPPSSPDQAIAPGIRSIQNLRRLVNSRRRNLSSVVPSSESFGSRDSSRRGSSDGDSIGDLELSYSSSLELTDDLDARNSSFEAEDVPLEGRPRRMRTTTRRTGRGRGNRHRSRRVRGLGGSPLNAPLQPSDGSIV